MSRVLALAVLAMMTFAPQTFAQGREALGNGRLVTNDLYGDTADRWQSGSVAGSHVVGHGWTGFLPDRPFDIIEYRINAQVATPAKLGTPAAGDRPFAGVLSLGAHSHFARAGFEFAVGADLAFTGPQTGLSALHVALHDLLGTKGASKSVTDNQIGNGIHPTFVGEAGRSFNFGNATSVRPFVETRWGLETLVRAGADLTIGNVGQGELLVRDPVTGQRYRVVKQLMPGFSYVLGGDIAYVDSSALLPTDRGYDLTDTRSRVRAGVHWQGDRNAAFYGVTYLSEEYTAQPKGQVVGSVRLDFKF
ncbi:lipid A-modifier LpxR family protein [Tropicibacter alexandrii]|uniref:lipid A-modifier LpxR family protein n=1 Tax=Tropicibacter alexandrii TaxID=2267683 RepID=UPI000EF4A14B|nr:lipid A-modifier LpxR family protein [Tropicibacter alexandrii]